MHLKSRTRSSRRGRSARAIGRLAASALPALALSSCLSMGSKATPEVVDSNGMDGGTGSPTMPTLEEWFKEPAPQEPDLYPGGEGVHDAPTPGFRIESQPGYRDVQPTETGRMHLLELYQQAIDERESFELELRGVTQALERAHSDLDANNAELAMVKSARKQLEEKHVALVQENIELASRLATAQIRRLEAEKMLLEAKIEMARPASEGDEMVAEEMGRP